MKNLLIATIALIAWWHTPPLIAAEPVGYIYTINGNTVMRCQIAEYRQSGAGTMSVIVPDSCTQVIDQFNYYDDVPKTHWALREIDAVTYAGITSGCGGGNFCPDAPVTRAQLAAMLARALHLPLRAPLYTEIED